MPFCWLRLSLRNAANQRATIPMLEMPAIILVYFANQELLGSKCLIPQDKNSLSHVHTLPLTPEGLINLAVTFFAFCMFSHEQVHLLFTVVLGWLSVLQYR